MMSAVSSHASAFCSATPDAACIPVAFVRCVSYERAAVQAAVNRVLEAAAWPSVRGCRVLVKPNLLRAAPLCCTHPEVTRAVCLWLLEQGAVVRVADSPGFGTARGVARHIGLETALAPLGLRVESLNRARPVPLRAGGTWGVSRLALESDVLVSVPRIKAHAQMRLTLATKNLFGCVCGLRKAVAHTVQGERLETFADALADLHAALPPARAVADGVTAMHVTGPSGGEPFPLGCLGASASAVALDTGLCLALRAAPEEIPLWAALLRRGAPGALPETLRYPLLSPDAVEAAGFRMPGQLADISFRPRRLLASLGRRVWASLRR